MRANNKALRLQALKEEIQKGSDSGDPVAFDAGAVKKKARECQAQRVE
jgi:hypothetical protein